VAALTRLELLVARQPAVYLTVALVAPVAAEAVALRPLIPRVLAVVAVVLAVTRQVNSVTVALGPK
jgi:hypothetical protein